MRKPAESLDNFNVKAESDAAETPGPVSLRFTGELEVLQPLVRPEELSKFKVVTAYTYVRPSTHRQSWFHRLLALGGSFALIASILLSAVLVGIYEPTDEPSVGSIDSAADPTYLAIDQHYDTLTPAEEPLTSDMFSATSPLEDDQIRTVRSTARPRRAKPRIRLAAYRPLHYRFRRPLLVVKKFVPTTLVIYAENGEIKTRIERQLTASYKNR